MKKKLVFLTGSGISVESGLTTFRDAGEGLWENVDVKTVATHAAWEGNPSHVNNFYNMLRTKYADVQPNDAHKLIKELENDFDVTVITQNVDNLHEKAGSSNVLHLHGEVMKMCSSFDVENMACQVRLPEEGFGENGLEVPEGQLAKDGSLLRPYIVFFGEAVPNMAKAAEIVFDADILVIIGTSLVVYPAAGLAEMTSDDCKIFLIDPADIPNTIHGIAHIKKGASEGMKELLPILQEINQND